MQIWKLLTPKHEALVVQENPWSECDFSLLILFPMHQNEQFMRGSAHYL